MSDPTDVDRIVQDLVEVASTERIPSTGLLRGALSSLASDPKSIGFFFDPRDRSEVQIELEDLPNDFRFGLDDLERSSMGLVAEGNEPTHPEALALRRCDLVPDPLPGDLSFELSE